MVYQITFLHPNKMSVLANSGSGAQWVGKKDSVLLYSTENSKQNDF